MPLDLPFDPDLDLRLERVIRARPETVWRCWEDPELMKQWFVPKPVECLDATYVLSAGGATRLAMRLPDGTVYDETGCCLLAEKPHRLIFTDALGPGFRPRAQPFMTADVRLDPAPEGTRYTALVYHHDRAARVRHEEMGFHDGWGTVAGQLAELAERLEA